MAKLISILKYIVSDSKRKKLWHNLSSFFVWFYVQNVSTITMNGQRLECSARILFQRSNKMISSQWQKKSRFIQFVQMRFPVATCEIFNKKKKQNECDDSISLKIKAKHLTFFLIVARVFWTSSCFSSFHVNFEFVRINFVLWFSEVYCYRKVLMMSWISNALKFYFKHDWAIKMNANKNAIEQRIDLFQVDIVVFFFHAQIQLRHVYWCRCRQHHQ